MPARRHRRATSSQVASDCDDDLRILPEANVHRTASTRPNAMTATVDCGGGRKAVVRGGKGAGLANPHGRHDHDHDLADE